MERYCKRNRSSQCGNWRTCWTCAGSAHTSSSCLTILFNSPAYACSLAERLTTLIVCSAAERTIDSEWSRHVSSTARTASNKDAWRNLKPGNLKYSIRLVCFTWILGVEHDRARVAVLLEAASENVKHGDAKQVASDTVVRPQHDHESHRALHSQHVLQQ